MGKRAPAPPPPPDPVATARAQSEFNVEAARTNASLNRLNQVTPQGTLTYSPNGPDSFTATVELSPEQRRLYDLSTQAQTTYGEAANAQLGQVRDRLSTPFEFGGPALTGQVQDRTGQLRMAPDFTGIGDPNQGRDAVQAALMSRINPDLERERAALESRLANQGITMGSEAWNTGMQDFSRMANDARFGAILNAGQEQSRMFGLGLQQAGFNNQAVGQASGLDLGRAQFGNAARQQSLAEQLALRSQPINEAAALLSGQQVQMPQFQNVSQVQVQAPDYQGAVGQNYAGQVANWNAESQRIGQQNAATAQAIGSLGGAALGFGMGGMGGFGFGGSQMAMSPQGTMVPIVNSIRPVR